MSGYEQAPRLADDAVIETEDSPQDECGVVGVWAPGEPVATIAYAGLHGVQHRGQSAAGLFVHHPDYGMFGQKGLGLVDAALDSVVPEGGLSSLDRFASSPVAVGHTRYDTSPNGTVEAAQPFSMEHVTLSHNGHIESLDNVAERFDIDITGKVSDSHGLTVIINEMTGRLGSIEKAMAEVLPHVNGAYCLVATSGQSLVVARDPWGVHPLALGQLPDGRGYVAASETGALQDAGASFVRPVERGEILTIDNDGLRSSWIDRVEPERRCMVEEIYMKDSRSKDDYINVRQARREMGRYLAMDHPVEADIVVPVLNGGKYAALGYAEQSGMPYVEGVERNPYALRSFILQGEARAQVLQRKFHIDEDAVAGRRIVLVDDSVIKGNTTKTLIRMLRDAGATEVHVVSAAPPNLNSCYMGLDTGNPDELIARGRTYQEIAGEIGADSIYYNTPQRIEQAVQSADMSRRQASPMGRLCMACSTGDYPFEVAGKPETFRRVVGLGIPLVRQRVALPIAGA